MKLKPLATICLSAFGFAVASAQEVKLNIPGQPDQPAAPAGAAAAAKPTYTDAQLLEEFGWFIGKRVGLAELEFSKAEIEALIKGLTAAASGKESPYELEKIGPAMDEFMQKKQQAYMGKLDRKSVG